MFRYIIMCLMLGFSGNKLFGKDKSTQMSFNVAIKVTVILVFINLVLRYL